MQSNQLTKLEIVQTLKNYLDPDVLKKLFPQAAPGQIWEILSDGQVNEIPPLKNTPQPEQPPLPATSKLGTCLLYTDGASRGNPGQAGAGAVLLDADRQELAARSTFLGVCTNNVAEYKALILGLETAKELGCPAVALHLDSELIVRQIQGRYKVKNETLKPLFQEVKQRLTRFSSWSITHVPRAENSRADGLANQGIDEKTDLG